MSEQLQLLALILYDLLVVALVVVALVRKRESASALGWSLAIVFLPVLGILLFLAFGLTRMPRRLQRKVEHREAFAERLPAVATGAAASARTEDASGWDSLALLARRLGAPPPRAGNSVTRLRQGRRAFAEIFAVIDRARHHVHVEKYTFRDDGLGRHLVELLMRKVSEGVEVRVIVDAVGSPASWSILRQLRRAGAQGATFMPIFPAGKRFLPNLRNHRKLIVCDGRVGFLGGLNVGEEYLGRRKRHRDWVDAHVKIVGPAVADMQRVFVEDWDFTASVLLAGESYFPSIEALGPAPVQIVAGGPDQETNAIRQVYFAAITRARRSLILATPYLVPDLGLRDAIKSAALRGVQVRILTQGKPPEMYLTWWASRHLWEELLRTGVQIHEYRTGIMHAKVIVADGEWATLGSANLDNRSLVLNFELNAIFERRADVRRIERFLEGLLREAPAVDLEEFRARQWPQRAAEVGAHLFAPLL